MNRMLHPGSNLRLDLLKLLGAFLQLAFPHSSDYAAFGRDVPLGLGFIRADLRPLLHPAVTSIGKHTRPKHLSLFVYYLGLSKRGSFQAQKRRLRLRSRPEVLLT